MSECRDLTPLILSETNNLTEDLTNYSKYQSEIPVEERKLPQETKDKINELVSSNTNIFTKKDGKDDAGVTAEDVAKAKLQQSSSNVTDVELINYSALGVANKAIKASFNDEMEAEKAKDKEPGSSKSGKREVTKEDVENGNYTTKAYQRHGRVSFVGVNFEPAFMNSFANCEFDGNCNFSKIVEKKNKFANCTFGDDCTAKQIEQLAKIGSKNLSECKFSKGLIERMETEIGADIKSRLNIGDELDGDCYKSGKVGTLSTSISAINAIKVKAFDQIVNGK